MEGNIEFDANIQQMCEVSWKVRQQVPICKKIQYSPYKRATAIRLLLFCVYNYNVNSFFSYSHVHTNAKFNYRENLSQTKYIIQY